MKRVKLTDKIFERFILLICAYVLLIVLQSSFNFNLPIARYIITVYASYLLFFKISSFSNLNTLFISKFFLILYIVIFIMITRSLIIGLPELIKEDKNYINLKQFIGEKALLYSFPFLMLIKPRLEYWRYFLKYSYLIMLFTIPFLVKEFASYITKTSSPEILIRATAGVSGFFLILMPYFNKTKKRIILFVFLISIFFMLFHARRNMVLYFGSFMIFNLFLVFFSRTIIVRLNRIRNLISLFLIIANGFLFYIIFNPDFSLFAERVSTGIESRENVIEDFFDDIILNGDDFLYGRGMYGSFYSTYLAIDESSVTGLGSGQRYGIENGYLQLILNFGLIYVLCLTLVSLYCFYKAILFSNNLIVKACGILILINLIDMIGFGIPEVSLRYFLVWFSMPFCLSKEFRGISDLEIIRILEDK